jgi:hypothetical protein
MAKKKKTIIQKLNDGDYQDTDGGFNYDKYYDDFYGISEANRSVRRAAFGLIISLIVGFLYIAYFYGYHHGYW